MEETETIETTENNSGDERDELSAAIDYLVEVVWQIRRGETSGTYAEAQAIAARLIERWTATLRGENEKAEGARSQERRIRQIRYGLTKNLGNYESARLDAEVEVEAEESPEQALERVKAWVGEKLGIAKDEELDSLEDKLSQTKRRLSTTETACHRAEKRFSLLNSKWQEAVKLLEAHGIEVNEKFPDLEASANFFDSEF